MAVQKVVEAVRMERRQSEEIFQGKLNFILYFVSFSISNDFSMLHSYSWLKVTGLSWTKPLYNWGLSWPPYLEWLLLSFSQSTYFILSQNYQDM